MTIRLPTRMRPSILLLSWVFLCSSGAAQIISQARVASEDGGPVTAILGGHKRQIAPFGYKAWVIDHGRQVAYSSKGSGGFENEGQTLYLYDSKTAVAHRILSTKFEITSVERVESATGKAAYLVSMEDGGLGATHIAVVDPPRGQVFHEDGATFSDVGKGSFTVNWYRDEDWAKLAEHAEVKPERMKRFDLEEILKPSKLPAAHGTPK